MFIIFNKRKVYSYLVSLSTVVVLFAFAFIITTEQSVVTSSKINNQQIDNKITITVENNWNENDVQNVLQMLNNTNTKATFSISKDWSNKFNTLITKIKQAGHEVIIKT